MSHLYQVYTGEEFNAIKTLVEDYFEQLKFISQDEMSISIYEFAQILTKLHSLEEQKDFVVLGTTLLLVWAFPGAALLIIGLVLIFLLM